LSQLLMWRCKKKQRRISARSQRGTVCTAPVGAPILGTYDPSNRGRPIEFSRHDALDTQSDTVWTLRRACTIDLYPNGAACAIGHERTILSGSFAVRSRARGNSEGSFLVSLTCIRNLASLLLRGDSAIRGAVLHGREPKAHPISSSADSSATGPEPQRANPADTGRRSRTIRRGVRRLVSLRRFPH
jgi:hypothetical protein